jgi:hypothetical protein
MPVLGAEYDLINADILFILFLIFELLQRDRTKSKQNYNISMYFNTLFLDAVAVSNYTTPNGLVMDEL